MIKGKVYACEENFFNDRQEAGKQVCMYRITALFENLGAVVVWTQDEYKRGEEIALTIAVGKNMKPVVKVA